MEGEINFEYGASEPLVFASEQELIDFLEAQARAWSDFFDVWLASNHLARFDSASTESDEYLRNFLSRQKSEWLSIKMVVIAGRLMRQSSPELLQEKLTKRELILIEDPLVVRARALIGHNPGVAEFFLQLVSGDLQKKLQKSRHDPEILSWYAKGLSELATTDAALDQLQMVARLRAKAQENFLEANKEGAEALADLLQKKTQASQEIDELIAQANKSKESADAQWVQMRATYDNQLKLSAPKTYWDAKREEHKLIARNWRNGFFAASATGLLVLAVLSGLMIHYWKDLAGPLGEHAWIVPVLMAGIPAFMMLWLLRLCGRLWSEHMTREEDARERIVMIQTFLALSRSEDSPSAVADSAQLALVLGAIFRAGPGFGSDDSPPAGLLEALVAKLGVSKGN
jgi:hypothetical protein